MELYLFSQHQQKAKQKENLYKSFELSYLNKTLQLNNFEIKSRNLLKQLNGAAPHCNDTLMRVTYSIAL